MARLTVQKDNIKYSSFETSYVKLGIFKQSEVKTLRNSSGNCERKIILLSG